MAFLVEDGSGISGANSYRTVVQIEEYLTDRGYTAFVSLTSGKTAMAIRATGTVENLIRPAAEGYKTNEDQGLTYPRYGFWWKGKYVPSTIPELVLNAVCLQAEVETLNQADGSSSMPGNLKRYETPDDGEIELFEKGSSKTNALLELEQAVVDELKPLIGGLF